MPAVSVLMKPSSSMCNMSCDYCFYCDEAEKRSQKSFGFMSEQTLKNVIRRTILRAEGMISYAFQGGEPAPVPEEAPVPKGFVCKICGFIYEGDTLPDDYVCPICRRPASDFEPLA